MPHIGRFDLVFDIGGGIASHHLDQTLARNVGLGLFVTAPRCDNSLIELTRFSVLVEPLARRGEQRVDTPPLVRRRQIAR